MTIGGESEDMGRLSASFPELQVDDTIVKLFSMMFGFMAPILGLLGWIIKRGFTNINLTLEKLLTAISLQTTEGRIDTVRNENVRETNAHAISNLEMELRGLKEIHTGDHNLCRFNPVQVDAVHRAALKSMKADNA